MNRAVRIQALPHLEDRELLGHTIRLYLWRRSRIVKFSPAELAEFVPVVQFSVAIYTTVRMCKMVETV